MHSFNLKAALAAFLLSTTLAAAHAAGNGAQGMSAASNGSQGMSAASNGSQGMSAAGKAQGMSAASNGSQGISAASKAQSASAAGKAHSTSAAGRNSGHQTQTGRHRDLNPETTPNFFEKSFDAANAVAFRDNTIGDDGKEAAETTGMGYAGPGYFFGIPVYRHAMTAPHDRRLAHVVDELGATNRRIAADSRRGHLTAAETSRVRREEQAIRRTAFRTADEHGGALPKRNYERLQADIHSLNRQIHRYATA